MPVDGALNVPGEIADVTYTRSRQTMGDDQPRPGTSIDHATFSVVDQRSGSDDSSAMPDPDGPRNCGHSEGPVAAVVEAANRAISGVATRRRIARRSYGGNGSWGDFCDGSRLQGRLQAVVG